MHLIVPFAGALSEAGRHALHDLRLPNLERLLSRLAPGPVDAADEFTRSPPHERALGRALGWNVSAGSDGLLPWAARLAESLALDTDASQAAWGLLTPVNLHVGTDQVTMTDPADLGLDADASRELFEIVRPLFETEGFGMHWAGPLQWLATHPDFDGLATASPDRAIGRNIDPWLTESPRIRLVRRIQNEVQMTMYTHEFNERRESAGLPLPNSFWLSGCGRRLPALEAGVTIDDRLRRPALAEDWVAWRDAWSALDATALADLIERPGDIRLSLCGERGAQTFERAPRTLWARLSAAWQGPALQTVLERL